ncbi:MAG: hypothetical protein QHH07_10390 [Sedimentisphaerales bacterium]|nr:hypothetical protein [Sedimentisphaerales bacterium]
MARQRINLWISAILVAGGLANGAIYGSSPVEELTKVLPDNLLFVAATSGGDSLKADFEKAMLGQIWNDPSVQAFCQQVCKELMAKLQEAHGADEEAIKVIRTLLECVVLSRPMAIGVVQAPSGKEIPLSLFVIIDASDRKSDLEAVVGKIEAILGQDHLADLQVGPSKMRGLKDNKEIPLYWGWQGNRLVFAANDPDGAAIRYLGQPRPAPADYLKKVPGHGDALMVYCAYGRLMDMVGDIVAKHAGEGEAKCFKAIMSELGIAGMGALTVRAGFSGPDMVVDSYLHMPQPRKGLLAAFRPIDTDMLRMVPQDVMSAGACNYDLSTIFDVCMNAIKACSPDDLYPEVQKGLESVETQIQVKIRDGLIKGLAGPMVHYVIPAGRLQDAQMGGFVLIARLTDAGLFEKNMVALGQFISSKAKGMFQTGSQTDDAGRTYYVWAIPPLALAQLMPTWSVVDGHAIIAFNTALCRLAVEQITSKDRPSVLDNVGYKKVAVSLPKGLLSLRYVDSQTQFNTTVTQLQQAWPMLVMAATQSGLRLPVVLPALGKYAAQMQPGLEYSYADAEGFYSHYQGTCIE